MRKIFVLLLSFGVFQVCFGGFVGPQGQEHDPLPETVTLSKEAEQLFQSMKLQSPDIIQKVRWLLWDHEHTPSKTITDLVCDLAKDERPEAKQAVVGLLDTENHITRVFVVRSVNDMGDHTAAFYRKLLSIWPDLKIHELSYLAGDMRPGFKQLRDDSEIRELGEEIIARLIVHPSKQVPQKGIHAAKVLGLKSDRIIVALRQQRTNDVYNYFRNEHPIRKAALQALGEKYVPPEPRTVDYSAISISQKHGMKKQKGLTVGLLTSLYTAIGPSYAGDGYGWCGQHGMLQHLTSNAIPVRVYLHPIGELNDTPLPARMAELGIDDPVLNSANPEDLSQSDVILLTGIYNLRAEVIDALEEFVWRGGGLLTVEGAGIVGCLDSAQLAALQDMDSIQWNWSQAINETMLVAKESPLTAGLDFSVPYAAISKNSYVFRSPAYEDQILLRYRQMKHAALRIGSYGKGRIGHLATGPRLDDERLAKREWELFRRVLVWCAGKGFHEVQPEPVFSKERYPPKRKQPGQAAGEGN